MKTLFSILIGISLSAALGAESAWNSYLNTLPMKDEIQANCWPRIIKANKNTPLKGSVLAIHGFTACPQQYFELAKHLSDEGYNVILPLMPGHGRVWIDGKDHFEEIISGSNSIEKYKTFATHLNKVMREEKGEKVIIGLSVGGAVSLLATELDPDLYQRSLAISPYLGYSKEADSLIQKLLKKILGPSFLNFIGAGEKQIGWGEGCEKREKDNGRAGICNFKLAHIHAAEKLGDFVRSQYKNIKTKTQLVGVEKDKAINNNTNLSFYRQLYKINQQTSLCLYPAPANHSLLSRFDSPDEDKFWLDSFLESATSFVTQGTWIATSTKSKSEAALLCDLN
jgi:esterase/lipase